MVGIVALLAFGLHRVQHSSPAKTLRVAAVQTNVSQTQKLEGLAPEQILDTCDRLSALAVQHQPDVQLIVWPEGSFPQRVSYDNLAVQLPAMLAERSGADLLFGADSEEGGRAYNSAVLVSPKGEVQLYRKVHLVPFGEYIPLRHSFPPFAAIAGIWVPGDFAAGTEHTVFDLTSPDIRVAPLICFEDTVGDLVRRFVVNGANLLVDVTNDGWFLHSSGSRQHLANAIFRCVENRRPMVRAANTGVTCFVNEFGHVTQILQDDTGSTFNEGVLTGEINVPQDRQLTFYARHGEWLAQVCVVVTFLALIFIFVRRKRGVI
jgi:apolipoprotein N-acyltransferase